MSGEQVELLKGYLVGMGYLKEESAGNSSFDDDTRVALVQFQNSNAIDASGVLDEHTLEVIWTPGCKYDQASQTTKRGFKLWGNWAWPKSYRTIRWTLRKRKPGVTFDANVIQFSIDQWKKYVPFNFVQTDSNFLGNIVIDFDVMKKRVPDARDDEFATTLPPKKVGGQFQIEVILDRDLPWGTNDNSSQRAQVNMKAVMTHEVGHALGLTHSENPSALMWWKVPNSRTGLHPDDINGIRARYGT